MDNVETFILYYQTLKLNLNYCEKLYHISFKNTHNYFHEWRKICIFQNLTVINRSHGPAFLLIFVVLIRLLSKKGHLVFSKKNMLILHIHHGPMTQSLFNLLLSYSPLVPKQISQISVVMVSTYKRNHDNLFSLISFMISYMRTLVHKRRLAVFSPSVQGHLVCSIPDSCLFRTLLKRLWVMERNSLVYKGGIPRELCGPDYIVTIRTSGWVF